MGRDGRRGDGVRGQGGRGQGEGGFEVQRLFGFSKLASQESARDFQATQLVNLRKLPTEETKSSPFGVQSLHP